MINTEMAQDYIDRAKRYVKEAERAYRGRDFPTTVRRSQEALELSAKALLRYLAIEYPREHDVGDALSEIGDRIPDYIKEMLPKMKKLLSELARVRGPAMYGYEREGIPASKAFKRGYANETLREIKVIVKECGRFITQKGAR